MSASAVPVSSRDHATPSRRELSLGAASWPVRALLVALVAVVIAATRWPLLPEHLVHFDAVNFALGLERFSPRDHQPQPPGYALFVALGQVFYGLMGDARMALFACGVVGGTAAVMLVWLLGERLFSPVAGVGAALLLLFHPSAWLSGLTSPVRLFLAVLGAGTALLVWEAVRRERPLPWFLAACAALGLGGGFRPVEMWLLVPLLVWAAGRRRLTRQEIVSGAGCFALGVAAWFLPTLVKVGGLAFFGLVVQDYGRVQFSGTSLVYGAAPPAAGDMAWKAFCWTFFGALAWLWMVPIAFWRRVRRPDRDVVTLLLLWFVPGFLFSATVHVGDPDHMLLVVPVLCLLGGVVLQRAWLREPVTMGWFHWVCAVLLTLGLSTYWFFVPVSADTKAASHVPVRELSGFYGANLSRLQKLAADGPLFVVLYSSPVSFRMVSYYLPDSPVLILRSAFDSPRQEKPWLFQQRALRGDGLQDGRMMLPACGRIAWLFPPNSGVQEALRAVMPFREDGAVLESEARPGMEFAVGQYRFASPAAACRAE